MKNKEHKPFDHQVESVKFLLSNKRAFNFSDLGTGKTLSALWAADFLLLNNKINKVLVVAPLSTLGAVWGQEIFYNLPYRKYVIVHGSKPKRLALLNSAADFYIINHDGVTTTEINIINQKFDLIIIDELTAYKSFGTNRSKAMRNIANHSAAVWGMTGDPTPNTPTEAFGQAHVVNPANKLLPKYFTKFRQSVEYQLNQFTWLPKADAKKIVSQVLRPSIRFKRDMCIDIPPCQYIDKIVEFTSQQKEYYEQMKEDLLIEYEAGEITASNAAVKAMKLLQVAAGGVKDSEGQDVDIDSKTRDDELWHIFEETSHHKLVIFCTFRAAIRKTVNMFIGKKVKVDTINGSVSQKKRADLIRDFQEGDLQVLVIQPQSSAHGITLTAASTIVWQSLIASGEIYKQANGRITRAGQTRKQLVIHLIGCKAERHILDILNGKGRMSAEILGMFEEL